MSNGNKNQWFVGLIIVGIVIIILIVFNYQGKNPQDNSLSEIFPEEATKVPETEYEFVSDGSTKSQEATQAPQTAVKTGVSIPSRAPSPTVKQVPSNLPSQPVVVPQNTSAVSGAYSIQVLSSKDKTATEKTLEKIKTKGHAASMVTKDLGEKGIWYRINVGSFTTKKEAEDYLPSVKNDYKDSFIVYIK